MKLKQPFNNNVVLAVDNSGNEVIVMGKGVGFNKRKYDMIDEATIDKIYTLNSSHANYSFKILDQIPGEYILATNSIIEAGERILDMKLSDALLITLADHINFAMERHNKDILMKNPLHWEVKKLYPREYAVGREALDIIFRFTKIKLPDFEASSIALHFVNAQYQQEQMSETMQITEITNRILGIISYHFQMKLDENSMNYSRFLTHLRYFILRQLNKENEAEPEPISLYDVIKVRYESSFECARKIAKHLQSEYGWHTTQDELTYLTLHLHRMTSRTKKID